MSAERKARLPNFLLEDFLDILRGMVGLAWASLGAAVVAQAWIRTDPQLHWPTVAGFSTTYNLVLGAFAATTVVLTLLLVVRDWYERVPRAAVSRVRVLLVAVVIWGGLHYFAAFHVTGSLGGPMLVALPILIVGAFLAFPARGAWATTAYVLAGHAVVLGMESQKLLSPQHRLAEAFGLSGNGAPLALIILLCIVAVAIVFASLARTRLDEAGSALLRGSRINPLTGLYQQPFFLARVATELGRMRRQGGTMAVLFMELDGFTEFTTKNGYDAGRQLLERAGQSLIRATRAQMDTPARYGAQTFSVLLPDASSDLAENVAIRIAQVVEQSARSGESLKLHTGIALVPKAEGIDATRVVNVATEALNQARDAGKPLVETQVTPL